MDLKLEDLFKEHLKFTRSKFTDSTWVSSLRGLEREIKEVELAAQVSKEPWENWVLEYVDCMMYLIDSMDRAGIDLDTFKKLFLKKMVINEGREWKQNKDKSYSHIKNA